jgi:DNA mismatch endonuclease (patch repair protein)
MSLVKTTGTEPERRLRSMLHARGLRFRVNRRPVRGIPTIADLVFAGPKVAVFVDGCFWHGCPDHASWPKSNGSWWRAKIDLTRRRDAAASASLTRAGWLVVRVWEHEDPVVAAARVESAVYERRATASASG